MIQYVPDLKYVINWLENGCNVADAVAELKIYQARIESSNSIPEPTIISNQYNDEVYRHQS